MTMNVLDSITARPGNADVRQSASASILVIDDEEQFRGLLAAMLIPEGYEVTAAGSGTEAVEWTRQRHFDVAIVDIAMQGMDGLETLCALKGVDPNLQVVVMTGYASVENSTRALRQGASDFLVKPFSPGTLYACLTRALQTAGLRRRVEDLESAHASAASAEAQIRAMLDAAQEAIVLFDQRGMVYDLNLKAEEMFGRSREQVLGRSLIDFAIPNRLFDAFKNHIETAWREGRDPAQGCQEVLALRRNGEEFPLEISTVRIETTRGKFLSTFARDISERVRAQQALQDSEAKLKVIFEGVEAGILLIDPQTHHIVEANPPALELIGAEREAVIGTKCHKFVCPADDGRCPVTDLGQKVDNSERVLLTVHGNRRPIIKTVRPVVIAGRSLLLESFVDISDRKRAEQSLRESEDRYRDLVENSFALIGTHDAQGKILSINCAAARIFEAAEAEEVIGRSLAEYVPPDRLPQFEQYLRTILREGAAEGLMAIVTPSGKRKIIGYRNTLRRQEGQEPIVRWAGQDITERVQAEEALRLSEKRYRLLFERNLAGVLRTSVDGRVLGCNDSLARMLGYSSAQEMARAGTHDIWDDLEGRERTLALLRQQPNLTNYEVRLRRQDGKPVWALLNFSRIEDEEASSSVLEGTVIDISQRKEAEEELQYKTALLEAISECTIDGVLVVDGKNHILHSNRRFAEIMSLPPALAGSSDDAAVLAHVATHAKDPGAFRERVQYLYAHELESARDELELKNGRIIDRYSSPLRDAQGRHYGRVWYFRDMTERIRAEQQMRLQMAALESAGSGIAITDREGCLVWVNPAFTRLTGYSRDEIVGQNPRVLKSGKHAANFYETLWKTILSGEVWQGEIVNRRKDGSLCIDDTTITPVRDTNGAIAHFVAIKQDATERKRAEQALEERTAYLNTLFEISPFGIVVLDTDGRIQMSNSAFERLFRFPREELFGVCLDDFVVPRELVAEAKSLTAMCLSGAGAQTATQRLRKDGTRVEVAIFGVPLAIEGELRGYLALYQDITERKRAEAELVRYAEDLETSKAAQEEHAQELARLVEELAQERDLLGTVMDNLPDFVYYKDRQSRFLRTNWAHARLLGLDDPQQAVGKTDFDFFAANDAQIYFEDEQQVMETGRPLHGHIERVRRPGGQCGWCLTSKVPVRDTHGQVVGLVGITRDITERIEAEETLRASEERYRELFENASDIVYTTELDTRITSLNRVGQQALGYSEEEAKKLDLRQLVVPKHLGILDQSRERLKAGESDFTYEVEVTTKDGRPLTLEVKPRMIYRGEKPVGVQGIARDITGREAAEMELRHAQKLESVGRLASGIAHEINTPIQFVGDNTRFLQDSFASLQTILNKYQELREAATSGGADPDFLAELKRLEVETDSAYLLEEIPKALTQTLEGVTRVATIVRAMKEFAHPESRALAAADLNKALQSTLTVARNELKYVADVETEFGELPMVVCNIGDLNQVFLNLLINAAHAIAEAVKGTQTKGKIRVRTLAEVDSVLISIADTGCGIPEAIRSRIFDPFFTTKEVGRGTGQGLAISRSVVVDRHKGSLTFETEVGKGTTFFIRLPLDPITRAKETNKP